MGVVRVGSRGLQAPPIFVGQNHQIGERIGAFV